MDIIKTVKYTLTLILTLTLIGLGLSACSSHMPSRGGFLSDYSKLKPGTRMDGSFVYFNPDKNLGNFNRFFVEQVQVFLSTDGRGRGIDPTRINELTEYFRTEIINALKEKYEIAGIGGREPGTLQVRLALTDLKPTGDLRGKIEGDEQSGGASLEGELVDYETDEVVVAFVVSQTSSKSADAGPWGNTREVLKDWAHVLRSRIDEARAGQMGAPVTETKVAPSPPVESPAKETSQ